MELFAKIVTTFVEKIFHLRFLSRILKMPVIALFVQKERRHT